MNFLNSSQTIQLDTHSQGTKLTHLDTNIHFDQRSVSSNNFDDSDIICQEFISKDKTIHSLKETIECETIDNELTAKNGTPLFTRAIKTYIPIAVPKNFLSNLDENNNTNNNK